MAKKALVVYANGSEAIEVTAITDILKRVGVNVTTATVNENSDKTVELANGTKVIVDKNISEVKDDTFDVIAIPGGIDGSNNCKNSSVLIDMLKKQESEKRYRAAICAAPGYVLGSHNLIGNAKATGYPGCDTGIKNYVSSDGVVFDKDYNLITGQGPAYSMDFAFTIASVLVDNDTLQKVKLGMLHKK